MDNPSYAETLGRYNLTPGTIATAVDFIRTQNPEDALDEYKKQALIVAEGLELVTELAVVTAMGDSGPLQRVYEGAIGKLSQTMAASQTVAASSLPGNPFAELFGPDVEMVEVPGGYMVELTPELMAQMMGTAEHDHDAEGNCIREEGGDAGDGAEQA